MTFGQLDLLHTIVGHNFHSYAYDILSNDNIFEWDMTQKKTG